MSISNDLTRTEREQEGPKQSDSVTKRRGLPVPGPGSTLGKESR